jgi:hypothetical protein
MSAARRPALSAAAAEAASGQKVPAVVTLADLLRRPHVHYALLEQHGVGAPDLDLQQAAGSADTAAAAAGQVEAAMGAAAVQPQHPQQQQQQGEHPADQQHAQAGGGEAPPPPPLTPWEKESAEIDIKYEGFIRRQVGNFLWRSLCACSEASRWVSVPGHLLGAGWLAGLDACAISCGQACLRTAGFTGELAANACDLSL